MSLFKKIFTAVRGAATEVGEGIVDANGIRIMEQEIRDAEDQLAKSKQGLTSVMAQEMATTRKVNELRKNIEQYEDYAIQALDKDDESLATDLANKIASSTDELAQYETVLATQTANVNTLKQTIRQTTQGLQATKREVALIKSTQSVQKAQEAVATSHAGSTSSMTSAMESLQRIKARQQEKTDKFNAANALEAEGGDGDLQAKMAAAGIGGGNASSGSDILAKLKARKAGN